MFAKHAKASLWSWIVLLVLALVLVSRIALGRRLQLTSSIRRCLGVIAAADKLSGLVGISVREKASVTLEALAVVLREVPARGIANHGALRVALLAEALGVHHADFLGVCKKFTRL